MLLLTMNRDHFNTTVVMSRREKDEQLIKTGDDELDGEEEDMTVAVIDNPIYDVDPDERAGAVAYHKTGYDDDEDEEVKVHKSSVCCTCKKLMNDDNNVTITSHTHTHTHTLTG